VAKGEDALRDRPEAPSNTGWRSSRRSQVDATQQVAQLESEGHRRPGPDDARLAAEETYARAGLRGGEGDLQAGKPPRTGSIWMPSRNTVRPRQPGSGGPRADRQGRAGAGGADRGKKRHARWWRRFRAQARGGPARPRVDARLRPRQRGTSQRAAPGGVHTCTSARRSSPASIGMRGGSSPNYRENSLENLRPGQRVGLAFNTYPGRIFSRGWWRASAGGVDEGQGSPSGNLPARPGAQRTGSGSPSDSRFGSRPRLPEGLSAPGSGRRRERRRLRGGTAYWLNGVTRAWQRVVALFDYLH